MLRSIKHHYCTTLNSGSAWVSENPGQSVVFTPCSMHPNSYNLFPIDDKYRPDTVVSIVICTYGRPESLNETLESLTTQTYRDFEVIIISEKGNLSELRDKGLRSSKGDIVSFIDDDVYCPPAWIESVVKSFREGIVGVTGPTTIEARYKQNRDCFKFARLRKAQEWLFKVPTDPGKLSTCGAPSMASNDEGCRYEGEVDYLECCNMSVKRKEALSAGGFDPAYYRTSEWCEVDLALSLRAYGKLWFSPRCQLYHRPSQQGIYKARIQTKHRWENLLYFHNKWRGKYIKHGIREYAYLSFIWVYFTLKTNRMI